MYEQCGLTVLCRESSTTRKISWIIHTKYSTLSTILSTLFGDFLRYFSHGRQASQFRAHSPQLAGHGLVNEAGDECTAFPLRMPEVAPVTKQILSGMRLLGLASARALSCYTPPVEPHLQKS